MPERPSNKTRVDLSKLDLRHIEDRDLRAPDSIRETLRPFTGLILLGFLGFALWFPYSNIIYFQPDSTWPLFITAISIMVISPFFGRWFFDILQRLAERFPHRTRIAKEDKPPATWVTWLTLAGAVVGSIVLIVISSNGQIMSGGGTKYSSAWYIMSGCAVLVGVLAGRWLWIKARWGAASAPTGFNFKLPVWFKWVNLGIIVTLGLLLIFANTLFPEWQRGPNGFVLSGIAFAVAIGTAFWFVRRMEEYDTKHHIDRR